MAPINRHPPTIKYCGLTIVLSKPSRLDTKQLISGYAGQFFENCLQPVDREAVDIRLVGESAPLLPNTRVILSLGPEALEVFKPGGASLTRQRGCPFVIQSTIIVIPTFAPQDAYDRRNYDEEDDDEDDDGETKSFAGTRRKNWRWWMHKDIKKALRILFSGLQPKVAFDFKIYPPLAELNNYLLALKDETIFLDIETSKDRILNCVGLGIGNTVWVVPFRRYNNTLAYSHNLLSGFLLSLISLFRHNSIVAHNGATFDFLFLSLFYKIPIPNRPVDTMVIHHRCFPEIEKSLGHLISLYTDEPYHKDENILNPTSPKEEFQLWNYNAKDVATTALIYHALMTQVSRLGMKSSVSTALKLIRPVSVMTLTGIKIDETKIKSTYDHYERAKGFYAWLLSKLTNRDFNPRSPAQVSAYLYDDLKLERPTDEPTSEANLLRLLNKTDVPSIRVIIESRGNSKKQGSLKYKFANRAATLRGTTVYNVAGTDTFRLSSRALFRFKSERGLGTNLQNQHKDNRIFYVPDEGKIFVQIDQAGAEAKIVAYLCRPGKFRDLFIHGIKPHVYMAMVLFKDYFAADMGLPNLDDFLGADISSLKTQPLWPELSARIAGSGLKYDTGKMVIHAANYGMKSGMFQMQALKKSDNKLILTLQQCKKYLDIHHHVFNEIPEWWLGIQEQLRMGRVLKNLFGHARYFGNFWGEELFKQAYAFIPQSTVGEITNMASIEIQERIEADEGVFADTDLLNNCHDSLLFQCPIGQQVALAAAARPHLERSFTHNGETFTMGTEVTAGFNWQPASAYNPNGLTKL
jgi:DNA polymerase I-like protein with 3'-5' exonuclease and polymerase domains